MTVNIGLVTSEALILGCDSIASTTNYFVDPFDMPWEKDAEGNLKKDADGNFTIKFNTRFLKSVVTNAWGGVTKMFPIHDTPSPVVAVTAGLAKMNDRPMSSLGNEFLGKTKKDGTRFTSVEAVAREFCAFMKSRYDAHYEGSKLPESFRDGPEFLVGGFCEDDVFPSLYRVIVKDGKCVDEFSGGKTGISWNGQSDGVERFVFGYDGYLRGRVSEKAKEAIDGFHKDATKRTGEIVNDIIKKLGVEMPEGIDLSLPTIPTLDFGWAEYNMDTEYANLPLQDAINFVSFLVMVQAGRARFARGVATVGGRTHIGIVTKDKGFRLLNEPDLQHRYTGFGDDL